MKTILKVAKLNNRHTLPIIRDYVLFDKNTACSTDLEVYAVESGAWYFDKPTIVPIVLLKTALAMAKKPDWKGDTLNGVKLESEKSALDYPLNLADNHAFIPVAFNGILSDMLKKVKPAMSYKDIRYYLKGILFDGNMVATNGHRLHIVNDAFNKIEPKIVPRQVFDLIEPTEIAFSENYCKVNYKDGVIYSKLIEGKFPDYDRVIPSIKLDTFSTYAKGSYADLSKIVAINKANNSISGAVLINEEGELESCGIKIPCFGKMPYAFCVNAQHLKDAVEFGTNLHFTGKNDSVLITGEYFKAVVMPMRI